MSEKDGGTAFPSHEHFIADRENGGERKVMTGQPHGGMSLRDYFAAAALPSVIAAYLAANGNGCAADHALRNAPALAFKYADAMLEARKL